MDYIEPFSDERHNGWCIHCGVAKGTAPFTRDHVPSKSLLDRPLPDNVPTFDICGRCNNELSRDEEYLKLLIACIFEGTCEPDELRDEKAARALRRNGRLLADLRRARQQRGPPGGDATVAWQPDPERMMPPLIKNAKGHFIYELGEPPEGEPAHANACALPSLTPEARSAFERVSIGAAVPEIGSRMMIRLFEGPDRWDGWIVVQPGVYRYAVHEYRAVRIVIREYLAFEAVWD